MIGLSKLSYFLVYSAYINYEERKLSDFRKVDMWVITKGYITKFYDLIADDIIDHTFLR